MYCFQPSYSQIYYVICYSNLSMKPVFLQEYNAILKTSCLEPNRCMYVGACLVLFGMGTLMGELLFQLVHIFLINERSCSRPHPEINILLGLLSLILFWSMRRSKLQLHRIRLTKQLKSLQQNKFRRLYTLSQTYLSQHLKIRCTLPIFFFLPYRKNDTFTSVILKECSGQYSVLM